MIAEDFDWVGFAADIFGPDYHGVENQTIRVEQATLYRSNNTLFASRIQAAIDTVRAHPAVDEDKVSVIGCKFIAGGGSNKASQIHSLILL